MQEIVKAQEKSMAARGFVIRISRNALEHFRASPGDEGYDLRLDVGEKGLPLTYVSGIEPQGPAETIYLEKLKKKLLRSK